MSNPFLDEARKTNRAKLSKEGGGKDREDSYARAKRIAKGYADGGEVTPLPPSPFNEVKGVKKPKIPAGPTVPPVNKP